MSDLVEWHRLGIFHEVVVSKLKLQPYENLTGAGGSTTKVAHSYILRGSTV